MPKLPNYGSKQSPKKENPSQQSFVDFSLTKLLHQPKRSLINPPDFTQAKKAHFDYGDRLRWIPVDGETDWGVVIGKFYSYAPHSGNWEWCYLLLLDKASKSATWCQVDTAWEEDLELVVQA